jgi:geranylgeranyl reductase family protein
MPDVIVVGAGPAGSVAATVLARRGVDVLLVDRESFPRHKVCGDVIAGRCFELMGELGLAPPSDPEAFYPIHRFVIRGPKGGGARVELAPGKGAGTRVARRDRFDELLWGHALKSGARFRQLNVQGLLFEGGQVAGIRFKSAGQEEEIPGRIVIAADGATSAVARALKQPRPRGADLAVGLRGYVRTAADLDPAIELSFLEKYHPGYAWFLPVSRRLANVGIGLRADYYRKNRVSLPEALAFYTGRPEIQARVGDHEVEGVSSWQLPMYSGRQRRLFDGAILAGDAGGFVSPLTGDGIYQAMVTARYAAEACLDALGKGDLTANGLALYQKLLGEHLRGELGRARIAQRLLALAPVGVGILLLAARLFPALAGRVVADYGQVQAVKGL